MTMIPAADRAGLAAGRRQVLLGAAAIGGVVASGLGARPARAAGSLKVGTYGGYFKDSFDEHIYPDFTKETGIEVESIAEPTGGGLARAVADGSAGRCSPCRRVDDGPGRPHQGPEQRALGKARRGEAAEHQEPARELHPPLSRRQASAGSEPCPGT